MNKLVIALLVVVLSVLAVVSAEKPKRLGCGKYCMTQVLEKKVAKEEFRSCVRTCVDMSNDAPTRDDSAEMVEVVESFRSALYDDIQDQEAVYQPEEEVEEVSSERTFPFKRCVNTQNLIVRTDAGTDSRERLNSPTEVTIWASRQLNGLEFVKIGNNRWVAAQFLGTRCAPPAPAPGAGGRRNFPMQKQCDRRWGSNLMGSRTVCQVGCLMSSVSMAMAGLGKTINGQSPTPGVLNDFLRRNGGYQGNLFVWGAVARFGFSYLGQPSAAATIRNHVSSGHIVILNVNRGGHWVLATGLTATGYTVNDPGGNVSTYSNGQVVRAGVFRA